MSDVREKLQRAMQPAANISRLGMVWVRRFPRARSIDLHPYDMSAFHAINPKFIDAILFNYTEREIITILAAARLEGVWTPE